MQGAEKQALALRETCVDARAHVFAAPAVMLLMARSISDTHGAPGSAAQRERASMKHVSRVVALVALCWAGCAESDQRAVMGAPVTAVDAGDTSAQDDDAGFTPGEGMEPAPAGGSKTDAGAAVDAGGSPMPSGDPCMDAATRIAGCFLNRQEAGVAACKAGAVDATPTVARFLITGGSCPTLIKQSITLATPCDQAPVPMHVTQLVGYAAAAKLCSEGPANTAATCSAACKNAAPCVDAKMLDEKLKDPVRCFDGCIRNAEDAEAFSCSATQTDCSALAEKCWTAP